MTTVNQIYLIIHLTICLQKNFFFFKYETTFQRMQAYQKLAVIISTWILNYHTFCQQ